jgi:hypothetical protein
MIARQAGDWVDFLGGVDEAAAAMLRTNPAFLREFSQREAHNVAANSERLHDLRFGRQTLPRHQRACPKCPFKLLFDAAM